MPVPGLDPATFTSEEQSALRNLAENYRGVGNLASNVQDLLSAAGRVAGASATIGGGTAEMQAGEAAGEAIMEIFGWLAILVLLATILILRIVEGWLIRLAGKIPGFGLFNWSSSVRTGFMWLDSLENQVARWSYDALRHMMHNLGIVIFFLIGIDPKTIAALVSGQNMPSGIATRGQVIALQAQINEQEQDIQELKNGTGIAIPHNTGTAKPPPSYILLQQQYNHIEAQLHTLHSDVVSFNKRLDKVEVRVQSIDNQQQSLAASVHQVRAIATGWQEVEAQLEQLGTTVSQYISSSTVEIRSLQRVQVAMSPLTLLQEPGIRGLKVLRSLEDKPCQCPALPHIPSLMPERLALYEFMTNG